MPESPAVPDLPDPADDALPTATALLRRGIDEGLHTGAQLSVSRRGELVAEVAVGEARSGGPMTADDALPWMSQTKPLTAVAVLQQWERGEIDLDDPVGAHLPAFAANGKERVTVRHLLTHTGGLRNAELARAETPGMGWQDSLAVVCAASRTEGWVPGRRAGYQPRGTFLALAEIVRLLDGRPFEEYLREEVLRPFGMVGADARSGSRPSSGGAGPARDLRRFYEALLLDRGRPVLSPPVVEAMTARHRVGMRDETFGVAIDWGLGTMVNSWYYQRRPTPYGFGDHASPRTFGHGGSGSSLGFADPEHELVVVVVFDGTPGEKENHRRTQAVVNAVYQDLGLANEGDGGAGR